MTTAVQKIIKEVEALNPVERREVEQALRVVPPASRPMTEAELEQQLVAQGMVIPPAQPGKRLKKFTPVKLRGGPPISQMIIEERR